MFNLLKAGMYLPLLRIKIKTSLLFSRKDDFSIIQTSKSSSHKK
jgi:hypothetical protein